MVEVRLLGPVDLVVDGASVCPSASKIRVLLALLALDAGTPQSSEALADRLWAGEPPATAGSVLRTYISQLRRLLPDGDERIRRIGDGYVLRLAPGELDTDRFDSLTAAAAALDCSPYDGARLLREALSLWRGLPLVELADDPRAQAAVAGLEANRWAAVEALADAELKLGLHDHVVSDLEEAVRQTPLREQLVARLMLALYRAGRQADALAAFQRLRRALVDDLGLEPSTELRHLEAAVLDQDPSLDPPVRALGNLPVPLTTSIGRDEAVAELVAALGSARLVTLTGAGGTGKTRLAIEVARVADDRPDGAWFVDLSALREPADVATAVLDALGVEQRPDEDPAETVRHVLGERRALVVLDNCEHLVGACADLATAVLGTAPSVAIIATSRTSLGVPGELVWPVEPLKVPPRNGPADQIAASPAARLLGERIAAARGGRWPGEEEWPAVAKLCRRLDGLPLAIEIVAAQAATLSIADLAEIAPLQVAWAGSAPGAPRHHRSLAACVGWSLDLLDAEHRRLFEAVCLLRGPFSAGAAAAVAGVPDEQTALLDLAELARCSLVQPVPGRTSHFRVLETVRQVVRPTVDEARATEALDGLVTWAAAWGESVEPALRGPDAARILDDLDAERDVLRTALEHGLAQPDPTGAVRIAASISALWAHRGYLLEGQTWLTRALAVASGVEVGRRIRLLVAAGSHLVTIGDLEGFRAHVEQALALARAEGAADDVLRVLLWAGRAADIHDDHSSAAALYDEARRLAEIAGDHSSMASALMGLGDVAAARAHLDEAATLHLRALAEFRAAQDVHGEGQALLNVAEVDRRAGRIADAERGFRAAAASFDQIADPSCIAASREGLARVAVDARRLADAEELYRAAIDARRALSQERALTSALECLASVLADAGRPLEAAAALGEAGRDGHPLARRLREVLGDRRYLEAWADGSAGRGVARS